MSEVEVRAARSSLEYQIGSAVSCQDAIDRLVSAVVARECKRIDVEASEKVFSLQEENETLRIRIAELEALHGDPGIRTLQPGEKNVWRDQEITNTGKVPVYFRQPEQERVFVLKDGDVCEIDGVYFSNHSKRSVTIRMDPYAGAATAQQSEPPPEQTPPRSLDPLEVFATYASTDLSKPETWPKDRYAAAQCYVMAEENRTRGALNLRSIEEILHSINVQLVNLHSACAKKRSLDDKHNLRRRDILKRLQLLLKGLMLLASRERIDIGTALLMAPGERHPWWDSSFLGMLLAPMASMAYWWSKAETPPAATPTPPEEETG